MPGLPTKQQLLDWIRDNPDQGGKREIAKAFGLSHVEKIELKHMLQKLRDDGEITRNRTKIRAAGLLPAVNMLRITSVDHDGDVLAEPASWNGDDAPPPIRVLPRARDAFGAGDLALCKLAPLKDGTYEARPIKKIEKSERRMLGIFRAGTRGGRLVPVEKRASREWAIPMGQTDGAEDGELVEAIGLESPRAGLPRGRIVARHGNPQDAGQISLIAMVQHEIPLDFPPEVEAETTSARPVTELGKREDLRDLPLITIDPADARDHDDAVCALPDDDPKNPGGHVVWVAIADVAHYVRPGSALDAEARARGNSSYFPDRVSPMLPEALSTDLCSLVAGADRPCMAVRMVLNADGEKIGHRFTRGLMRSPASLDYVAVQAAIDGEASDIPADMVRDVLRPLYAAHAATDKARDRRQPLDLDLPERRIQLTPDGRVDSINYRDRLDAHRLIEEFMIMANVAAAETLEGAAARLLYRVHEEPNPDKLDSLRETVGAIGLSLARGQVLQTKHLNHLLAAARGTDAAETVAMSVLRSQTQAYYAPQNMGHFGLNLPRYAHFTSPIRRYADLIVHRALIRALGLGPDGLSDAEIAALPATAEHISQTERRSMEAERDTVDRYVAAFMADRQGGEFEGRIAGISRAGVFVRLDETGADGLVPISSLGSDYFRYDPDAQTLTGERSGRVLGLGQRATVRLLEATPISGGLILEILSVEGNAMRARQTGKRRVAKGKFKGRKKRRR